MDERTKEMQIRFKESWKGTLIFLKELINTGDFDKLNPLINFVSELENKEEWRYFRPGTSMHTLLFSKSIDFGLRTDQKYVSIETIDIDKYEIKLKDGIKTYRTYRISDFNDIQLHKLLQTLKKTLVD